MPLTAAHAVEVAILFVAVSFVSNWAKAQFGTSGTIVGVTDIDPFVLNLAQGGTSGMSNSALTAAILIAASSNNILTPESSSPVRWVVGNTRGPTSAYMLRQRMA